MNLSKRLTAVAGLITPGNSIADIGTDHGYIPIYMAQKGLTRKALAMDVNPGPLKRAVENINKYHVEDMVSARLSDGLSMLNEGETDTIVIAGIGGLLMVNILEKYPSKAHAARELILSPHSDVDKVRRFLADNGFCITHEKMVCEEGKYYFIMRVCTGDMRICDETEACFGSILLREKDRVLYEYLCNEEIKKLSILSRLRDNGAGGVRGEELNQELKLIRKALNQYES